MSLAAQVLWGPLVAIPEGVETQPESFPVDGLGPVLGLAAIAISRDVQAPDALAAGSVLTAASLAAMPHFDVLMPHGQRVPLSIFAIAACESGDRKTGVDQVVLREIEEVRQQQARAYLKERAATDDDAPKPTPRSLTVGKATIEGLQMILKTQPILGLFTSEGGELLGGHSMREERRSAGLAWLLKAWGGETLDALTRGDGLSILLGRRVALHAMVQPILLRQLLSDPLAQGQGLLARCLIAQPRTLAGTRLYRECNPSQSSEVKQFHERLKRLLQTVPQFVPESDGCELAPVAMQLSPDARALWIEFYDEIERRQASGQDLEQARAFASKTAEHAARIAGVVQAISDPAPGLVSRETMDGAMRVALFYLQEHIRLTGAGTADRRNTLLRTLAAWMVERGATAVPHVDVLQRAPRPVRNLKANGINDLLAELETRNYIAKAGDVWRVRRV